LYCGRRTALLAGQAPSEVADGRDHAVGRDRDVVSVPSCAPLDLAFLAEERANRDADRNAQEIGVLELDAGALVTIIQDRLEPGRAQIPIEALRRVPHRRLLGIDGEDVDLKGRDRPRPHDTVGVMTLLD